MSEFGVSELDWGAELPLLSPWKSCPWHASLLKHRYKIISLTLKQLVAVAGTAVRVSVRLQCQNSKEDFPGTLHNHVSVLNLPIPKKRCRLAGNPLREHFQPAQEGRGRLAEMFGCAGVLQYSREYGLQMSAQDHWGQNKTPWVLPLYFTSSPSQGASTAASTASLRGFKIYLQNISIYLHLMLP